MRRIIPRISVTARAPCPARSVFFGKLDNASIEVVFRSILRQQDTQRFLSNYFGRHMINQKMPASSAPVKVAPPACASDPHRVLRLYSCLAHPVLREDGTQEMWYPEDHPNRVHHSHGPISDMVKDWEQKRRWKQQDRSLHRGDALDGDEEFPWPSDDNRGHPVFWCENYKIRVIHAEPIVYLAQQLLAKLGRPATPEAADEAIEELYDGVDANVLEEFRSLFQRTYDEVMFYRPTLSRQWLEEKQWFVTNTLVYGGPYGAWQKVLNQVSDRVENKDVLDPQFMFVNPPINDEALRQPGYEQQKMM